MSDQLVIAIVSDLHCKHPTAEKEGVRNTLLYSDLARMPSVKNPASALIELIQQQNIHADILMCPGDISDHADQQGLVTGWSYLEEFQTKLCADLLAASIGNHDVNSHKIKGGGPFDFLVNLKHNYPVNFPMDCYSTNNEIESKNILSPHFGFGIIENEKYYLLIYNSCLTHIGIEESKKSSISQPTIQRIEDRLSKLPDTKKYRIALCHHHPINHHNLDAPDTDLIDKGEAFVDLLNQYNFQLVVHGHKHDPKLNYRNSFPILCAGSFSARMNVDDLKADNVFHLLFLEPKKKKGKIKTWLFKPVSGWAMEKDAYFPCYTGFGHNGDIDDLADRFAQGFLTLNKEQDYYKNLVPNIPEIEYLIPMQQKQFEKRLKDVHGIEIHPSLGDSDIPEINFKAYNMTDDKVLYDSFNARYLTFEEVVDTFIANEKYTELLKNNHSLLMGPRGSGKTTLLKMLTPASQYYWLKKHPQDQKLPFIGVYISTDIQWKRQIEQFQLDFKDHPKLLNIICPHLVTINVLISLCNTFEDLIEFNGDASDTILDLETKLSIELISEWNVAKPISPNISSITQGLLSRLRDINNFIKGFKETPTDAKLRELPNYYNDDYLDLVRIGCHIFKKYFVKHSNFKNGPFRWALCFDELEIAPKWLQMDLLDKLRSTSQDIIFKLTTVPIVSLVDNLKKNTPILEAKENDDYKIIRTWTYNEAEANKWSDFCEKLINNKVNRKYNDVDLHHLFGDDSLDRNLQSTFSEVRDNQTESYSKGSLIWTLFKEYALIDRSFRQFLIRNGIDPINPVPVSELQKASIFRKIKPIVAYRYQFRNVTGRRSRKNPSLFYGLPYMYKICDGNPRAAIGLIDDFLSNVTKNEKGKIMKFSLLSQSLIIRNVSKHNLHLIETNPDSHMPHYGRSINLGKILKFIGEYFEKRFLIDDFEMDPKCSFIVDKNVDEKIVSLLEVALHMGAIIYLEPQEGVTVSGIVGKKFRLSYLLHPHFRLPKIQYSAINLSSILNKKGENSLNQISLFNEY